MKFDFSKILAIGRAAAKALESPLVQDIIAAGGPQAAAIGGMIKTGAEAVDALVDHARDVSDVLSAPDLAAAQAVQARIQAQGDVLDAAVLAEGA